MAAVKQMFELDTSNVLSSKRKRAQVTYYDEDLDFEEMLGVEVAGDAEDIEEYSETKKRKKNTSKKASQRLPKCKAFPFLELPAEIRNVIYELCLTDPVGITMIGTIENHRRTVMRKDMGDWNARERYREHLASLRESSTESGIEDEDENGNEKSSDPKPRELLPALLAVNKQIYSEAHKLLWSNKICFADPMALNSFLVNIGPRAGGYLTNITIKSWAWRRSTQKAYNHSAFALLAHATNIQCVEFDCDLGSAPAPKWVARQVYRSAFPWLEAVGYAKGRVDAAVDLIKMRRSNFTRRYWRVRAEESTEEDDMERFRNELGKLLGSHHRQAHSTKKSKKRAT